PARITEPRRHLARIATNRLHDLPAVRYDRVARRGDAVDHDVDEQPWLIGRRSADSPGTAHLAGRVVERGCAIATTADVPAEHLRVKVRRTLHVGRRHLDVAD